MQRRHPVRRYGQALARRPRSPSTPPGPHTAARRGLRSRVGCPRCACAPPRRHTAGYPVIGSEARSARCHPSHCSLATRSIMHAMHCGSTACHERNNGPLSRLRFPRGCVAFTVLEPVSKSQRSFRLVVVGIGPPGGQFPGRLGRPPRWRPARPPVGPITDPGHHCSSQARQTSGIPQAPAAPWDMTAVRARVDRLRPA